MRFAYPRLETSAALELLSVYSKMDPEQLVAESAVDHPRTSWYETATHRVPEERLRTIRAEVRELARHCGYPLLTNRGQSLIRFDRATAMYLMTRMEIIPADAADEGVWSFMSLVLLPDVSFWRWPNRDQRENYERIIGRPRNVFRRLYGAALPVRRRHRGPHGSANRGRDGGNTRTAYDWRRSSSCSRIAVRHLAISDLEPGIRRTTLMREVMKRIRRLTPIVTLAALSDQDLEDLVSDVFCTAVSSLKTDTAVMPS